MSSRYLIPLAVAAALAVPVAAHAQEGTYDPGKWLVRVGMSQINPDSYNLDLGNGTAVVVDSDLSPTATVEYMITPHIGTELLVAWPFTHGLDLDSGGFVARTRKYIPLIVPVFMMAIRSADNLAMALESKGFGAHRPRTSYEEYKMCAGDIVAIAASIALFAVCLAIRIAGFGSV